MLRYGIRLSSPLRLPRHLGLIDAIDPPPIDRLRAYLQHRETLLLLDNYEHVITAAPLVAELLSACPSLQVLATSRTPLRISDELDFPVPPLALPDLGSLPPLEDLAGTAAVTLFIQRATAANPSFALTEKNAADVAEICVRLDGLPLAIELAAARTRLLAPDWLRARLANRLLLLTEGSRDQPPRLRSMRDAIAWSYDLLDPAEQLLFRRLAIFTGGFSSGSGGVGRWCWRSRHPVRFRPSFVPGRREPRSPSQEGR